MKKLTITVEPMVGQEINNTVEEAKQLARELDISYVNFSFNGVSFSVGQNAKSEKGFDEMMKAHKKEHKFVIMN